MSLPNDQDSNLESQLRDWGNRIPDASGGPLLAFEELANLREQRNKRFQRTTALGVMTATVMLVSWIATLVLDNAPLVTEQKNSIAVKEDLPELSQPNVPSSLDAKPPKQPVIYTKVEAADGDLRKRWVEAKRNNARDRVLEQWLAENM